MKSRGENKSEKIMVENVPNLVIYINLQIQKAVGTPNEISSKKNHTLTNHNI